MGSSIDQLREQIASAKNRTWSINRFVGDKERPDGGDIEITRSINSRMDEMLANLGDKDKQQEMADRIRAAQAGNEEARRSLNELRVEMVNNFIWPSLNFASRFFQVKSLGPADRPAVQYETGKEIRVGYIAEDGSPQSFKLTNPTVERLLDLRLLSSDKYGYRLRDLYKGDVAAASLRNVDVAFDLANKIDLESYNLLTAALNDGGAFGNFTLTGTKQRRVFVPHSRIDTSNLPTTNDLDPASNTGTSSFRIEIVNLAVTYGTQWANSFREGPLMPTGVIIVPSLDAADLLPDFTPTGADQADSELGKALQQDYIRFRHAGINWTIIPDNTIPPKLAYFQMNRPVGTILDKPDWDEAFEEVDRMKNYAERWQRKVYSAYILEPHRTNVLRIRYQDA